MKSEKERKIAFHTLYNKTWKTHVIFPCFIIGDVIMYILSFKKIHKKYDLKESKFCLLQDATFEESKEETIITGFFKSAIDSFRPNLIDRTNGDERKSPKKLTEGDIEKTHFSIKIGKEEVFLLLEVNGNGVSINQVVEYFGAFTASYYKKKLKKPKAFSIGQARIGRQDFLTSIRELKRSRIAEIHFDKSLLGSQALNFSNRTSSIKRDMTLTLTAEKNESITETAIDIFNKFSSNGDSISKIRIYGKDEDNNNVIIDTSFIEQVDFLNISLNIETGEIVTSQILSGLKRIIKQL
jgi:hypothetical protein